jgi:hypothetical protein
LVVVLLQITSQVPIKPPLFATMKSTNYLPNALLMQEAEAAGVDYAIWLDQEGFIAEGPNMNIAVSLFLLVLSAIRSTFKPRLCGGQVIQDRPFKYGFTIGCIFYLRMTGGDSSPR